MSRKVDQVRKHLQDRRREIEERVAKKEYSAPQLFDSHDEARDEPDFYVVQEEETQGKQKWLEKDLFLFQLLFAVCLFLIVAIVFKSGNTQLEHAKQFVTNAYEQEFQFASIANWYEDQFGRPMALLPMASDVALEDFNAESVPYAYAVPASGQVTESFAQNGTGILVETSESNSRVEAVKGGIVIYVGEEQGSGLGKTVIVQHYDGGESWYGMLDEIDVKLYDHPEAGDTIGRVSNQSDSQTGIFYFGLKEGELFIDPSEVIPFE